MDTIEGTDSPALTPAETRALRLVAAGAGKASWYQLARVITPMEYPGEDTDPTRILARLEQAGLVAPTPDGGQMRPYAATPLGLECLAGA